MSVYVHVCWGSGSAPCAPVPISLTRGTAFRMSQRGALWIAFPGERNHKHTRFRHPLTTRSLLTVPSTYWEAAMTHRWRKHWPPKQKVEIPDLILSFCFFLDCFLLACDREIKNSYLMKPLRWTEIRPMTIKPYKNSIILLKMGIIILQ